MHQAEAPLALRRHKKPKWDRVALLFILPYLLFLCTFTLYPTFMAVTGSFFKWDILTNRFVAFQGLKNYLDIISTASFYQALRNNLIYLATQVPCAIFGGLMVANLLNKNIRGRAALRAIYFLPIATGSVVLGIVWRWMYQQNNGILNYFISLIGMEPVGWLTDQRISMLSISLMKIWMDVGYYTIVFLGAFQSISSDLVEAATIDGGTPFQIFWRIKFPLLNPTIMFCVMMGTIWCFQLFNEPYIMTDGGPLGSSTTMALYLYNMGFIKHKMSYASAVGVVLGLIIMIVSIVERKLFEKDIT